MSFNVPTLQVHKEWHEGHVEFEGGGAYFLISSSSVYSPFKPYIHHRPERGHPFPSHDGKYPDVGAERESEAAVAAHAYRPEQETTGSKFIPNSTVIDYFSA